MYTINNRYTTTAFFTLQTKEIQINNTGDSNSNDNNIVVTTTSIYKVKTLKTHNPIFIMMTKTN